jgi:hypothetical protein
MNAQDQEKVAERIVCSVAGLMIGAIFGLLIELMRVVAAYTIELDARVIGAIAVIGAIVGAIVGLKVFRGLTGLWALIVGGSTPIHGTPEVFMGSRRPPLWAIVLFVFGLLFGVAIFYP